MSTYEEIIDQSQENLKALGERLKDLDKLYEDIKKLIALPETFDAKFQEIVKLSEDYTNTLGISTKKYLDGNNTLFTSKLNELSEKTKALQEEIFRLVNTDFTKLFKDLQKVFIDQTRKDFEVELKKLDDKSNLLQTRIDEFKQQIVRLENIDIEKHFDKFQKTLSEIFGAINSINLTLTTITQTLTSIVQSLGAIQNDIATNQKETKQLITSFSEKTSNHLNDQDAEAKKNTQSIESKIESISEQNDFIAKSIKTNRIIQIIGFVVIIIILIYISIK